MSSPGQYFGSFGNVSLGMVSDSLMVLAAPLWMTGSWCLSLYRDRLQYLQVSFEHPQVKQDPCPHVRYMVSDLLSNNQIIECY
jgi:hypothetical protein